MRTLNQTSIEVLLYFSAVMDQCLTDGVLDTSFAELDLMSTELSDGKSLARILSARLYLSGNCSSEMCGVDIKERRDNLSGILDGRISFEKKREDGSNGP
jgi:hypothetical protein